ncbi:MAG: DNA mismatch repair protein MutS, partial [Candidatus Jacksonbacteria bacterium]|nr:DNA mismatch repair protein MutS [Candidatus Jacksonbacteria bacterium]
MKKETTPLLEQYWKIKNQHKDAIVFFRLGDFYEMFGEDATEAAPILDLALTARFKNTPNEIPMAGIPHHAAENYIAGLTKAGKKVAIADQTSPAGQGKIVDRAVVRIITPGTTFSDNILQGNSNNYCASFAPTKDAFGIAFCDITTGDFFVTTVPTQSTAHTLLKRLDPAEILTHEEIAQAPPQEIADLPLINAPMLTLDAESLLTDHFNIHSLDSFGMDPENPHTIAAARLLQYLKDTQKTELSHLTHIQQYQWQSSMLLDETTIRNLELFYTQRTHAIKGSLLDVIDTTQTPMGGRLIRQWLLHPLLDEKEIEGRLNAVEECVNTPLFKQTLEPLLKKISDIERIAGKIGTARVTPRDLYHHRETLAILPEISKTFSSAKSTNFKSIKQSLQKKEWEELETLLTKELSEDPPVMIDSGNVMKDGFHKELDELRKIATGGKEWLAQYQEEQRKETGIEKLKIK